MGLDILVELGRYTIELSKIFLCLYIIIGFTLRDKIKNKLLIILPFVSLIVVMSIAFRTSDVLLDFIEFILTLIVMINIFHGKKIKIVVIYFITYIAICIVEVIIYFIVTRILGISPQKLMNNEVSKIFFDSISLVVLLLIGITSKRGKKTITMPLRNLHWSSYILIIWIFLCLTFLVSYIQYIEVVGIAQISNTFMILLVLATLGIVVVVILMTKASYTRDKFKALSTKHQEYLEIQQEYYLLLSEKNEDTKRFRHDINNHLLCLLALAQAEQLKEITEYITGLTQDFGEIACQINTGNKVVDAIINDTLVKHPNINFVVNGYLPNPLYISAIDLCTIFSNIIINAVEAIKRINDKKNNVITLNIKNLENNIYISTNNPISAKVVIINNAMITTKTDKEQHGFGMTNIQKCIDRYHGSLDLCSTETEFKLEIVIKNESADRSPI